MDQQRRALLSAGAGALLAQAGAAGDAAAAIPKPPPGKPGEFDFLAGEWRIAHRRLTGPGQWDTFAGEATCWTILGGVGSVEELRIPARGFSGLGLRLLDVENRVWVDHWVNARSGVVGLPGMSGGFIDGAGVFLAEDEDGGTPIVVRSLWDEIAADSCRWSQATSRDGGRTWEENWVMRWRRA